MDKAVLAHDPLDGATGDHGVDNLPNVVDWDLPLEEAIEHVLMDGPAVSNISGP